MNNITNNNGSALIISILFVFALLISSCIKEEIAEQGRFAGLIKVTGQDASTATKTTLDGLATIWNINDEVGIFSPQARTESGGSVAVANAMFTATQAAKSSPFTGTMFWGEKELITSMPTTLIIVKLVAMQQLFLLPLVVLARCNILILQLSISGNGILW